VYPKCSDFVYEELAWAAKVFTIYFVFMRTAADFLEHLMIERKIKYTDPYRKVKNREYTM
jgi:hypothetical protein